MTDDFSGGVIVLDGFMQRARLYGHAVAVVDEHLGEAVRERVMDKFSQLAGPLQRRGLRDPWDMVDRACNECGIDRSCREALHIAYLMRIGDEDKISRLANPDDKVMHYLQDWGLLDRYRRLD